MPRERKKVKELIVDDYQIAGNVFRTWHDADGRLIVVLDETIDEYKPYALLVMDSYGERKWDDVLSNDFDLDLETIRPKKENKYQKLDIEYDGLAHYAHLIAAYDSDQDISDALVKLYDFRDAAVRRAATERLIAASDIIEQSSKTAAQAERTITALQNRRHVLEKRLERHRGTIGREPAKESAAKILKTESQLEKNGEKLARSMRRLNNAVRRGDVAREDAAVARDVLARRRPSSKEEIIVEQPTENVEDFVKNNAKEEKKVVKAVDVKKSVAVEREEKIYEEKNEEVTETLVQDVEEKPEITLPVPDYGTTSKPEGNKMPDTQDKEEVKPLFDKDPEILDDEIAFKPVAFDDIKPRGEEEPVVKTERTETITETVVEPAEEPIAKPLSLSENSAVTKTYESTETTYTKHEETEPVLNTIQSVEQPSGADVDTTGQVTNTQYTNTHTESRPVAPNVAPAANRPISPITGSNTKVQPVGGRSKPTVVYYLLLIILIVLSVFTLWLYQKKNGGTVPFLNPDGPEVTTTQSDTVTDSDLFINPEPEPVVEPEPEPVVEPEPEPEPVVEPDVPINVEYPNNDILYAAEPEQIAVESEESVLSRKDPYAVSREDKPVERVTNVAAPDVIFDDDVISVPAVAPGFVDEEEMFYNENGQDAVYYQEPQEYYESQPQPVMYDEYVDDQEYMAPDNYVTEDTDAGFVMEHEDENDAANRKYLSVHDGGQYSVGYTETTY